MTTAVKERTVDLKEVEATIVAVECVIAYEANFCAAPTAVK